MSIRTVEKILEIVEISRAFPGVQALDKVSFSIQVGTIHALVGENGAGKSTLIKILSGALSADNGAILINGLEYLPRNPSDALQKGVATIYQELNLLSMRTVVSNITLGREPTARGWLKKKEAQEQVKRILKKLNSTQIPLDAQVGDLKISEKQIIEIAKAISRDCKILIMDEPTAALNASEVAALFGIIRELRNQGVTIIYVSHRLTEIFEISDYVTVLRDGNHIETTRTDEVTAEKLITAMIGRKMEGIFPPRNTSIGEIVLEVKKIRSGRNFDDISFLLHKGEVLAITGLSGSGKTELGKALFGDEPINSGTIHFEGKPYQPDPTKAVELQIGYIPEDRKKEGVLEEVGVERNLSLAVLSGLINWLGIINQKAERTIAENQVHRLGIKTPSLSQLVRNLSGGNQQKVSLGRWLARGSKVLIMMEPTQGIDVSVKFEIYKLINDN